MPYVIREQSSLLGREMAIDDQQGDTLFRVHGPVARLRDELRLDDASGVEPGWIKDPLLSAARCTRFIAAAAALADVRMVSVGNLLESYDVIVSGGSRCKRAATCSAPPTRSRGSANGP